VGQEEVGDTLASFEKALVAGIAVTEREAIEGPRLTARPRRFVGMALVGSAEARLAENFADNASGALSLAIRLASHAALIEQLRSSLASRGVIDQAIGIIMARERCAQDRAFAILP